MSTGTLPKIKILFLGANPSDTTKLALNYEVREIMQHLRATHQAELFEFVQEWAVRVGDLQAALLRHRPQIVHFSGHGRGDGDVFSRSAPSSGKNREMLSEEAWPVDGFDGEILVEDDTTRQARPIPARALGQLFEIVGGIRCVVLNACHSALQAEAICEHVEAVIGMRRSIRDTAAINFAWAFYQGLGFGQSLQNAFALGKNQIELAGLGDGEVPQLLARDPQSIPPRQPFTDSVPPPAPPQDRPSRRPPEMEYEEHRTDPFLLRVERVVKLRHPGARIRRVQAPRPFAGVIEVEVDAGGFFRMNLVAGVNQELTEELALLFVEGIDTHFRRNHPLLRSTLVHQGSTAPLALRARFDRMGIELQTFDNYQGLFDFQRYLEWQMGELERNPAYITSTYVDPPAWVKVAGCRELEHTDNALTTISELLATQQHRRFLLVLGEFGAGKTFLLRELCRRMVRTNHPVVPVLLEMSKLEKQHSLAELLGAHFARADVPGYNFKAFEYMLGEGRIALFFDGFDELADKVTYDSATQHLDTVLSATHGQAKVVLSSRRQHFLTEGDIHKAVEREFAKKAESAVQGGYRLIMLEPFQEPQIRQYLINSLVDKSAADARYRLLDEVKDLIGLSHNPRMLSFIAEIPEESLREAKQQWGEITAAKLYELLVNHWLDFEHARSKRQGSLMRISRQGLLRGVESLALSLWHSRSVLLKVTEIHERISHALVAAGEPPLDPAILTFIFGSGSLLVRDDEGQFSFVHRSVMEWLVARQAADELLRGQDPPALLVDEMSALMADFFTAMAGRERTANWAKEKLASTEELVLRKNATLLLARMGERFERVNFEGQDLRGRDFSGVDWRGANLRGADLRGAILRGADLRGASLVGANLSHVDLRDANLANADLLHADMSFIRAEGVDFSLVTAFDANRLRGANLIGSKGIPDIEGQTWLNSGVVPPLLENVEPMWVASFSGSHLAYNADSSILAVSHTVGVISLVDPDTCKIIRVLHGHIAEIHGVVFSPDGKSIASCSADQTIRLWDVATGRCVCVLTGHKSAVYCIAFAPDGKILASGSADKKMFMWHIATGRVVRIVEGHSAGIRAVAFSYNGQMVASGYNDNCVQILDLRTSQATKLLQGHTAFIACLAFSPDDALLASGSADSTVRLWDIATATCMRTLNGHRDEVYGISFAADGKTLASASQDTTILLTDVASGRTIKTLNGHSSKVTGIAFSSDGKQLASCSADRTIRIWRTDNEHAKSNSLTKVPTVLSVAFAPDGRSIAASSEDRRIIVWRHPTGELMTSLSGHGGPVGCVAFSPDSKTIASGSWDKTIRLYDLGEGQVTRVFTGHSDAVYCVAFSPDGKTLASGSYDQTVRHWDIGSRSLRILKGHTMAVTSIAFSPDGKTLASSSSDKTIRIWNTMAGRTIRTFDGQGSVTFAVAVSPDGKQLAAGQYDTTIRVWDIQRGDSLGVLNGHTSALRSVAFAPDGKILASGSSDNTVRLWSVSNWRQLAVFTGHRAAVLSVSFSPDGKTLASGSYDNTVRLWDVASGQCLAILLATPEGWVAFTPDGRYKYGGNIAGSFWHVAGLCRFEPGELDEYLKLRLSDDTPFAPSKG